MVYTSHTLPPPILSVVYWLVGKVNDEVVVERGSRARLKSEKMAERESATENGQQRKFSKYSQPNRCPNLSWASSGARELHLVSIFQLLVKLSADFNRLPLAYPYCMLQNITHCHKRRHAVADDGRTHESSALTMGQTVRSSEEIAVGLEQASSLSCTGARPN